MAVRMIGRFSMKPRVEKILVVDGHRVRGIRARIRYAVFLYRIRGIRGIRGPERKIHVTAPNLTYDVLRVLSLNSFPAAVQAVAVFFDPRNHLGPA